MQTPKELFIENSGAQIVAIKLERGLQKRGVRVYAQGPERIALQVRDYTEKLSRYGHVNLTLDQARDLVAKLQDLIAYNVNSA